MCSEDSRCVQLCELRFAPDDVWYRLCQNAIVIVDLILSMLLAFPCVLLIQGDTRKDSVRDAPRNGRHTMPPLH
jgi:hypothetical protein